MSTNIVYLRSECYNDCVNDINVFLSLTGHPCGPVVSHTEMYSENLSCYQLFGGIKTYIVVHSDDLVERLAIPLNIAIYLLSCDKRCNTKIQVSFFCFLLPDRRIVPLTQGAETEINNN